MFVQRDILMQQIEQLSAGLARLVAGDDEGEPVDEAQVTRAVGLGLDIAESLPADTVADLVEKDPRRLLLLGLAIGRAAWVAEDPRRARIAMRLIDRATRDQPPDPETLAVQSALLDLAFG